MQDRRDKKSETRYVSAAELARRMGEIYVPQESENRPTILPIVK